MDRERLTELIEDPSQVAKQDLAALRTMAERFPWFSGAHLLLAIGEHETGDVLANDRHGTPAAFLPSRAVLFDLVRQGEQQRTAPMRVVKDEIPLPPAVSSKEPTKEKDTEAASPEARKTILPIEEVKEAIPEEPIAALQEEETATIVPDRQALPSAPAGPPATRQDRVPMDQAAHILDLQIQEAILATGFDLGRYKVPVPEASPVPPEVIPSTARPLPPVQEASVEIPAAHPPAPSKEPTAPAARPISPSTRLRFTDWLERPGTEIPEPGPRIPEPPSPPTEPLDERTTEPKPIAPISPGFDPQEIMEQFIQRSSPLPPAAKAEFFNPQQAAKRSLQDDGLVSETLARIHEKQGNLAKAKEVYDRLALKHPGKSVYFAALSKALEGRMHK